MANIQTTMDESLTLKGSCLYTVLVLDDLSHPGNSLCLDGGLLFYSQG